MEKEEKENDPEGLVAGVNRLVDLVVYQRGSVVSRTIIDKKAGTVTLFSFDEGQYESMSTISTFPSLEKLDSAGSVDITMAGYGATTMVPDPSSGGLYVGRQNVELSSPSAALGWIYNFTNDNTSSTCLGDSGGPIFLGSPRKNGDPLRIVAVISRIERVLSGQGSSDRATGPCVNADVRAVNLATKEVAEAVCSLGGQRPAFCNQ